jgi:hypothetical protein
MVPFGRLIVTTFALVFPMIALTVSGPRNATDMIVRAASASILAGAVTTRVVLSVRSNARPVGAGHASPLRSAHWAFEPDGRPRAC